VARTEESGLARQAHRERFDTFHKLLGGIILHGRIGRPCGSGAAATSRVVSSMEQRRFFEVIGEESGEWLVLDGKRHPPRVICRCRGWNAPKNAALIVAALEAHHSELHSNFPSTVRGGQPSNLACHQARLNLRLHQSLQPESPGQDTGARRRSRSDQIRNPAFAATTEPAPVVCRSLRFSWRQTDGVPSPSSR
jgi:hypothetical protein